MKEIKFVDVGEGITEGHVRKWLVKDGDSVKEDQPVVQVETDKAVVNVPAPPSQGAMRRPILFAFVLSLCLVCVPTASPASDKKHDPEAVLISVKGCLKLSVTEYVIVDDTGNCPHNLIGNTAKLSHYVGRQVQIIGEPTQEPTTPRSRTSPQALLKYRRSECRAACRSAAGAAGRSAANHPWQAPSFRFP